MKMGCDAPWPHIHGNLLGHVDCCCLRGAVDDVRRASHHACGLGEATVRLVAYLMVVYLCGMPHGEGEGKEGKGLGGGALVRLMVRVMGPARGGGGWE